MMSPGEDKGGLDVVYSCSEKTDINKFGGTIAWSQIDWLYTPLIRSCGFILKRQHATSVRQETKVRPSTGVYMSLVNSQIVTRDLCFEYKCLYG